LYKLGLSPSLNHSEPFVVISDFHIGTSRWQYAMLQKIGVKAKISTLSSHRHYLAHEDVLDSILFRNLSWLPQRLVRILFWLNPQTRTITHALCSFPPLRVRALSKLPPHVKIIVNIGHRFHIHHSGIPLPDITNYFVNLMRDNRYVIASMSDFDLSYFEYYARCPLSSFLPVTSIHVCSFETPLPSPSSRVVLIGPSHNTSRMLPDIGIEELNTLSTEYSRIMQREAYRFAFIKDIYIDANPEKLANHPAIVIIPYSAFSISMIECYHMNIPYFVPVDELLLGHMSDVRLSPIYATNSAVSELDKVSPSSLCPSPNDDSLPAQEYWIKKMYFNKINNAIRYKSAEDLVEALYTTDLRIQRMRMKSENDSHYSRQILAWERIFKV